MASATRVTPQHSGCSGQMSTIHPNLSIPELIEFIKHSFRESEFDEVQNTLMDREKIMKVKMENLVTDCALLKKKIDLLENTQSFSVLEKCCAEEKLDRTQRRCEELDKDTVQMGETIKILRCEKLGCEEKLENIHRKCEEMEQRLVIMGKEIKDMRRDKVDATQAMNELKRKEIEADRVVEELQLKNVEANQTIIELRVKRMESDKAAEVYGSSLNNLDPRILKLETNLAKMLSVNMEVLPHLVHGTSNLAAAAAATTDAEEAEKNLPNFVEGGSDGLDNGQANADANDRVVVSPEVPATSGICGGIGLAKKGCWFKAKSVCCKLLDVKIAFVSNFILLHLTAMCACAGSNESAIQLGSGFGAVKAEVLSFATGDVIMISDGDSDDEPEVGDTTFTSSEQTNKRSRTDGGDDGKRETSTSSDSEDETDGKRRMFVYSYTRR